MHTANFRDLFKVNETLESLISLKDSIISDLDRYKSSVQNFVNSEFTSWAIAKTVFTNQELDRSTKLSKIHRAIAEIQELNSFFLDSAELRTKVLIAKRTRDSLFTQIVTSSEVSALFKSKTDRVSFTEKVLLDVDTTLTVIDANWSHIYSLSKWVHGEVEALNRLDSALRLDTQILEIELREPNLPTISEATELDDVSDAVKKVKL